MVLQELVLARYANLYCPSLIWPLYSMQPKCLRDKCRHKKISSPLAHDCRKDST